MSDVNTMSLKVCALCNKKSCDLVVVGELGIKSLQEAKAREEEDRALHFNSGVLVHEKCRKNYVNKRNIVQWKNKQENHNKNVSKCTRSHDSLFVKLFRKENKQPNAMAK